MKPFIVFLCLALATTAFAYPSGESDEAYNGSDEVSAPPAIEEPDDENDVDGSGDGEPEGYYTYNTTSNEEVTPVAPVPEEPALDFDALKELVYKFTNYTSSGFDTAELITKLTELESNIERSTRKLNRELEEERNKLNQLGFLLTHVSDIKNKLTAFQTNIQALTEGVGQLGRPGLVLPSGPTGGQHRSWATLYRSRGHSGRTWEMDFRTCSTFSECCKNFEDLDNDSQSIHTHDTCVTLFEDSNCGGESRDFYPGSSSNHGDFGSWNDRFSSAKPCNRS